VSITDIWLNPVIGTSVVHGYNQSAAKFPHDLLSFIQSSIVEADRKDVSLLYRFFHTLTEEWESIYGKIQAIPNLYRPETVSAVILEELRYNVAIDDNLNYIWGTLDELSKRRFVKYFTRFVQFRFTDLGITNVFETMTGRPIEIFSYFDYQWIVSGDGEYNEEMALGEEEDSFDPWLITEYHEAFGISAENITLPAFSTTTRYCFQIDAAVAAYLASESNLPEEIRVIYKPSMQSFVGFVYYDGSNYYVYGPPSYYFGQLAGYSLDVDDFRVGFEIDQYVYDICVMDYEETLSHEMCKALAKFERASHERVYIRYYRLIEHFDEDNAEWTLDSGASIDTENKILILT